MPLIVFDLSTLTSVSTSTSGVVCPHLWINYPRGHSSPQRSFFPTCISFRCILRICFCLVSCHWFPVPKGDFRHPWYVYWFTDIGLDNRHSRPPVDASDLDGTVCRWHHRILSGHSRKDIDRKQDRRHTSSPGC